MEVICCLALDLEREILLDLARRSKRAKLKKVTKMRTESVKGFYETLIMK